MNHAFRWSSVVVLLGALGACERGGAPGVTKVEPAEGVIAGGDRVQIVGTGFQPGKTQVEVRFGRRRAEQVVIASNTRIEVMTPPGERGPADVTVSFQDGSQFKIEDGFKYTAPQGGSDVRRAFFSDKPGAAKTP